MAEKEKSVWANSLDTWNNVAGAFASATLQSKGLPSEWALDAPKKTTDTVEKVVNNYDSLLGSAVVSVLGIALILLALFYASKNFQGS